MNDNDPVRVEWTVSIGLANAQRDGEFTIDRDEWDSLTPTEREKYLDECYQEEMANVLDGGWDLVNADLNDPVKED